MPVPASFAETGFFAQRSGDVPITRFQVLGERSSGTNLVKRLLGRNTGLTPSEALGWKHAFPHMMAVPHDLAVICVVRRADDWALSMFDKPWHATPDLQSLDFSAFLRAPWTTRIDRPRYFRGLVPDGCAGAPLQHDRDPTTGRPFETVFDLRRAKLASLLSVPERDCSCVIVRLEEVQRAPEAMVARVADALGAGRNAAFRPVVRRLGSKFKPAVDNRPAKPEHWPAQDYAFLQERVDTAQEALLGYHYP